MDYFGTVGDAGGEASGCIGGTVANVKDSSAKDRLMVDAIFATLLISISILIKLQVNSQT